MSVFLLSLNVFVAGQTLYVTCINNYIYDFLHSLVIHYLSSKNIQVNKLLQYSGTEQQKMSQIIYESDTICVTTRHDCVYYADLHLEQACPTFCAERTSAKFGLHAGNIKFIVQNEE